MVNLIAQINRGVETVLVNLGEPINLFCVGCWVIFPQNGNIVIVVDENRDEIEFVFHSRTCYSIKVRNRTCKR